MPNPNHPKPGDIIKAQPIKDLALIAAIEAYLANSLRDLALFILGINTNLRASDLRKLVVGDVKGVEVGAAFFLRETKTQKVRKIFLNRKVCETLQRWLAVHPWGDTLSAPLFPNLRTGEPLRVSTISQMVKAWCRAVGLNGHYSSHTLRKTFGHIHFKVHKTPIEVLMSTFNHSSQKQTLDYLCVDDEDVRDAYLREV